MIERLGRWRLFVLVAACLLPAVAACGGGASGIDSESNAGDGGDAPFDDPSQIGNDGSRDDADSSSGDSLSPPDNLTIDLPDGGTVTGSVSDTGYAYALVSYSADRYDEIVTFYDEWTSNDSRDWFPGRDSSYDSQGATVRGNIWDSSGSHIGLSDCVAGGGSEDFDAVCVQITDEG